ncbi:MAG: lysylphosphatidylglycerol synthase domain-containing protein, partial [Halobacteria archaeon]|nr:lysylphosphatidylglycerol synthase domain-containing protein [Halobacteria archaeon]
YMPLPGGLGSVEITLAIVLASLTALSLTQASAVALLYRICVYWFVLVLGGLSLSYLSVGMYEKGEAG